jgi:hypothetical protein
MIANGFRESPRSTTRHRCHLPCRHSARSVFAAPGGVVPRHSTSARYSADTTRRRPPAAAPAPHAALVRPAQVPRHRGPPAPDPGPQTQAPQPPPPSTPKPGTHASSAIGTSAGNQHKPAHRCRNRERPTVRRTDRSAQITLFGRATRASESIETAPIARRLLAHSALTRLSGGWSTAPRPGTVRPARTGAGCRRSRQRHHRCGWCGHRSPPASAPTAHVLAVVYFREHNVPTMPPDRPVIRYIGRA